MRENEGKSGGATRTRGDFFEREYRLDYRIHTYSKPLLCWGHGIVMGGGIGLMSGASHRVVSETSRLAMPEITIGLYPDVGGSWLLNRMPGRIGLFLALTGAHMNTADAFFAGLADFRLNHADWPSCWPRCRSNRGPARPRGRRTTPFPRVRSTTACCAAPLWRWSRRRRWKAAICASTRS